ncbi:MAG: 30S ribosomal protein S15 [Candidatus Aenigmarchaeota archaeon]|nr:30S ribosomal protein S15 [Candidatus Aenigmarchaeota archaeon]
MARMHSRKHGKSGSKKPKREKPPEWIRYKKDEVIALVEKLAKEGKNSAQIGLILRDVYGIPDVKEVTGKKITEIMKEKGVYSKLPEDLLNLMKRALKIRRHLEKHKHDASAIRGLELTESKIRRLGKYYKSRGILPENWKYDPEKLNVMIR